MTIALCDFSGSVDGFFWRTKNQRIQVNNGRLREFDGTSVFAYSIGKGGVIDDVIKTGMTTT